MEPNLAGDIDAELDLSQLLALLRKGQLNAHLRESSHYEGGYYIRIDLDADIDFTLEYIRSGDYMARAFASSVESLYKAASHVSTCLVDNNIRHRFEVYDRQGHLTHDLCYLWPE